MPVHAVSLKKEIIAETSFSENSAKKRKIEDHEFRSKSDKIQFRFNQEVLKLLQIGEKVLKLRNINIWMNLNR